MDDRVIKLPPDIYLSNVIKNSNQHRYAFDFSEPPTVNTVNEKFLV